MLLCSMLEINDVVLYCIVLYCIVLYCIVLYCIVILGELSTILFYFKKSIRMCALRICRLRSSNMLMPLHVALVVTMS